MASPYDTMEILYDLLLNMLLSISHYFGYALLPLPSYTRHLSRILVSNLCLLMLADTILIFSGLAHWTRIQHYFLLSLYDFSARSYSPPQTHVHPPHPNPTSTTTSPSHRYTQSLYHCLGDVYNLCMHMISIEHSPIPIPLCLFLYTCLMHSFLYSDMGIFILLLNSIMNLLSLTILNASLYLFY